MPVYVILALASSLFFSLSALIFKLASKYSFKSPFNLVFYLHICNLLFLPLLLLFSPVKLPMEGLSPLFYFSVTYFLGVFFASKALYSFDISVLHPFFHFQTIFSVGLAYFFLGEHYPLSAYLWIALIIIGGLIVSMNDKFRLRNLINKNFLIFVIGIFFYACSDIFVAKSLKYMDVYNLKFWSLMLMAFFSLLLLPFLNKKEKISLKKLTPIFSANLSVIVATILVFTAFSYNITISQPLAMFGSLFTLIISIVLSRIKPEFLEHASGKVYAIRVIGVALMIFSAIMIVQS